VCGNGLVTNFLTQRIRTTVASDNGGARIAVWDDVLEETSSLVDIVLKVNTDCVDTGTTDSIGMTSR
jgi:hypothetical protein